MDFLNPRRRKAHRRRLFIGYALMSIVIAIGTMLFLYLAYGYDIDRKTGDLIQNGIVFVDSKPGGAAIYVNDVRQGSRTDTRMVLPAGVYTIRLEAEDYRVWERTFNLEGGQIQRLVYPFLLPNNLAINDVASYESAPKLITQSPDRRWVLVQRPEQVYQFDMYDLNDPERAAVAVSIPTSLLSSPSAEASVEVIEWANDNRHVLLQHTNGTAKEVIVFDRENPTESVNVNTLLGIIPTAVTLKDKRFDQLYYLESSPGVLRSANTKNRTISAPLASEVITYKSYGEDIILYATQQDVVEGKTDFRILERDKTYTLKTVEAGDAYVLDVSRYDGAWYYVVGSSADDMAFVYENPLPSLKQEIRQPLLISAILRLENPRFVSFSANTQFIALQSGNQLVTIDLEDQRQYRLKLNHDIPTERKIKWMDGHRFIYVVSGQSYIIDFDGSNEETLVSMQLPTEPMFDRDYDNVFTIEPSKVDPARTALTRTVIEAN